MAKIAPKSTGAVSSKGKILYCENDGGVLSTQSKLFEKAGYFVEKVQGRKSAEQSLKTGKYDIVVLGHTLTKDDRHHLPYIAKKAHESTRVLVLHASGKHPAVDYALDSRDGEKAVLAALNLVAQQELLAAS